MENFVSIDFETANEKRSSVCSVGMVRVEEGYIVDEFYELIKPVPEYYKYWNTRIHGLTLEDTLEADEFPAVWKRMQNFIEDLPLIAHNSPFDEGCLRSVLNVFQLPHHKNPFYCTVRASRRKFPQLPNHKLNTVAAYVGFPLENHHHALADAQACAHIAMEVF